VPGSATTTAVVNQKGGVGKTTTAFNVGALLAVRRRVLLVDLDAQSTLSVACGFPLGATDGMPTSYEILTDRGFDPAKAIVPTEAGPDLIPAKLALATAELSVAAMMQREFVLKEQLAKVSDRYDHILIDCSPSLGLLTVNALTAANRVLVPCQTELWAIGGLLQLEQSLALVRMYLNPALPDPMILPTLIDTRISHDREALDLIRSSRPATVLDAVVRRSAHVKDANTAGKALLHYDPNGVATRAYRTVAEVLDAA
jgi:chromosome partitioning protein